MNVMPVWTIPQMKKFTGNRWQYHDRVWEGRLQKAQSPTSKDDYMSSGALYKTQFAHKWLHSVFH